MADSLSLSLQAFPTVDKEKESLKYLIERINEQKGSFRNVTEESLEEEIQTLNSGGAESGEGIVLDTVEDVEDFESKKKVVTTAKDEMLNQVFKAQTECTCALDFMSLLLSDHSPGPSQATISPYPKQNIPLGSLGGEVIQAPQLSEIEKRNREMVSIGWRMTSLSSAADSLFKTASRLEKEMEKETRYWNHVLAVKEKGWSVSRLPREKHTLGVCFGFAEAYSDFRDRGLAALRCEEDGSLSLDCGFRSRGDRTIRVRLLQQGKQIASTTTVATGTSEDDSVETKILNARNSLFDEELHHEIHREARTLVNQGVRCLGSSVLIPFESNKQLEIDLVSSEDSTPEEADDGSPLVDNITTILRILLSYAHRQNLWNRMQKPPVLRESKPSRRIYPILKPVVEYIQHHSYVKSLQTFLEEVRVTIGRAGLKAAVEASASSHDWARSSTGADKPETSSAIEALIQRLTSCFRSIVAVKLDNESAVLEVDLRTTLFPPNSGTTFDIFYKACLSNSQISQLPRFTQASTLAAAENHIVELTTLLILHHLLSSFGDWRTSSPHGSSIVRNKAGTKDRETVSLALTKAQLSMTWQRTGSLNHQEIWTWEGEGMEGTGETRSLIDIFRQLQ